MRSGTGSTCSGGGELEPQLLAVLMGLSFFFLLFIGFPVAIALATSGFNVLLHWS